MMANLMRMSISTCVLLCAAAQFAHAQLPWELIAEKYTRNELLSDRSGNFSVPSIPFSLKAASGDSKADRYKTAYLLQSWADRKWHLLSQDSKMQPGQDRLDKGFYKVMYADNDALNPSNEYYFLIEPDWKNELLAYCQTIKNNIENHPRSYEISASIVMSHFVNMQTELAMSDYLTSEILTRLSHSTTSKQQFEQNKIPDLAVGLNKLRFKRFPGADFADFVLNVPDDYDPSKKWPVYIHIDPKRAAVGNYGQNTTRNNNNFHKEMLDMWWHSVSHNNMRWKDYLFLMNVLKKKMSVDTDRIYLYGFCQNGIPTMALTVNHPDQWAQCIFSTGNSHRHLAGNAFNLPVQYDNAHPESANQTAYFRFASKCFKYNNCRYFESENSWAIGSRRGAVLLRSKKISSPDCIKYTIDCLRSPKAYWVTILGREDENFTADIEASVNDQTITINRKNIDAYRLDLKTAPLDHTRQVTIIDNQKSTTVDPQEVFTYQSSKYNKAEYVKTGKLNGPISDVFTDPYTVLYTTGNNSKETNQIQAIAKQIARTGPVLPENGLTDEIIQNRNIVIVGRTDRSKIFNQISDRLPIRAFGNKITFDGQSVNGDIGVMMIHPNPLNDKKYIAIMLANSDLALKRIPKVFNSDIADAKADVAIFKVEQNNEYDFVRMEKFNTVWHWHDRWSVPLIQVVRKHSKWQWRQWIAYVIRHQLQSDVAIVEDMIELPGLLNNETLTLRDLSKALNNQWLVKIKLNGRELKKLLMQFVQMNGPGSNKKRKSPAVDGVSFVKSIAGNDCMHISEIKTDRYYTVTMPYKAVNSKRFGVFFKDYEIVGDSFLLPVLYEYLKNRDSLPLDDELAKMKISIL